MILVVVIGRFCSHERVQTVKSFLPKFGPIPDVWIAGVVWEIIGSSASTVMKKVDLNWPYPRFEGTVVGNRNLSTGDIWICPGELQSRYFKESTEKKCEDKDYHGVTENTE
jgi:hypothetical protein